MRLSDVRQSVAFYGGNWRELARCRETGIEMVPGTDGQNLSTGDDVRLAKKTCAICPVRQLCLDTADAQVGVWGGLTKDERDRLRLSNEPKAKPYEKRTVTRCEGCGLPCVPAVKAHDLCDECLTDDLRPKNTGDFKAEIIELIDEGKTHAEIGLRLGFRSDQIRAATRKWKIKSKAAGVKRGGKRDDSLLAPCGTPAARRRHQRRGEQIASCACRLPGSGNPKRTMKNGWVA